MEKLLIPMFLGLNNNFFGGFANCNYINNYETYYKYGKYGDE